MNATWEDNNNTEGFRPEKITVTLWANGQEAGTATLAADNSWQHTWTDLQKYENGQPIVYTVTEEQLPNYNASIAKVSEIAWLYTVTNICNIERTTASIVIAWDDNDNSRDLRPGSVSVKLLANDNVTGPATVEASEGWKYTCEDLQKYENATEIAYSYMLVNPLDNYVLKSAETSDNTTTLILQFCVQLNETDGVTPLTTLTDAAVPVRFSRTFNAGKASTVCLPFAHEKGTEGDYYTFGGVQYDSKDGKWKATMNEYTGETLAANTPYLFMPVGTEGTVTVEFQGMAAPTVEAGTTVYGDWMFKGVYELKTWAADDCGNDYGFAATSGKATDGVTDITAGDFVRFAEGAFLRPMRAYLTYNGTVNPWASSNAPKFAEVLMFYNC